MSTHRDDDCPNCRFLAGEDTLIEGCETSQDDIFYRNEHVTGVISLHWWPNNAGHAVILPNTHIENLYELPFETGGYVIKAAREIAIAFKEVYSCDGVSTRQHNGRAGGQSVFHYHMHVFPRYHNDYLYDLSSRKRTTTVIERLPYAQKLRDYFGTN